MDSEESRDIQRKPKEGTSSETQILTHQTTKYDKIRNKDKEETYNEKVDFQYNNIVGKIDQSLKYLDK